MPMRRWLSVLLFSLVLGRLPAVLAQQDDSEPNGQSVLIPKPADLHRSHKFTPPGWPLELKLPPAGALHIRGDADWVGDSFDFLWQDHEVVSGSGEIYRIEGYFQPLEFDPLSIKYQSRDHLFDYCWSWLSGSLHAHILASRRGIEISGLRWQEFRVEEPVQPHIEGREVKRGQPPLRYYLYASPVRKGMLVVRFFYDDPPRPDLPHRIALMLRYPPLPGERWPDER
jgi:hypothetical protein